MKIKKSVIDKIIKEEALKIKKVIALQEEKKEILKQLSVLNEDYAISPEEEQELNNIEANSEQTQEQPIQEQELDEGKIVDFLKSFLNLGSLKQKIEQIAQSKGIDLHKLAVELAPKFQGKSITQIKSMLKGATLAEDEDILDESNQFLSKLQKAIGYAAGGSGAAGVLSYIVTTVVMNSGANILHTPWLYAQQGAASLIATAMVATIIYIILGGFLTPSKKKIVKEEELDEIFGLGKKDPEKEREEALKKINSHPGFRKAFAYFKEKSPEKVEPFIKFFEKNKYGYVAPKWVKEKGEFVDSTRALGGSHGAI